MQALRANGLRRLLLLLLVGAAALLVLRTLPARLGLLALPPSAPLVLTEVEGRWWDMGMRLGLADARGGPPCMLPGRFALRWRGLGWSQGPRVHWALDSEAAGSRLELALALTMSGLRLDAGAWSIGLPLDCLSQLGAPFNTLAPQGRMQWRHEVLSLESSGWRQPVWRPVAGARGELRVLDAASAVAPLRPLGSWAARWRTLADGELQIDVVTERGPLVFEGSGRWVGGQLRFQGRARSEEQAQTALANLLAIIGRREAADASSVSISF